MLLGVLAVSEAAGRFVFGFRSIVRLGLLLVEAAFQNGCLLNRFDC
jgi:hypothetical protein